ncbi:MAG: DNA polymerase III subunit beta [Clostridium sp.]|nr:DNA polymerase III subunit beta [Clostridium sp.]MCM1443771.1 DNA polymerase III subunit beta [Candidatus Amulumruptor caecigallinarius]
MKLKIKQSVLIEHLNYVIRGISNKNLIPILNCIKFELTSDGLYLMSSDNDIAIKTFIPKEEIEDVDTYGKIVVSGRYIYDIVKKLPNEIINLEEVMDFKLYITTSNSSFTLNCNDVNDFPPLELEEQKNPIIIPIKVLKNIINQTVFATSTQESRPILTGVNIKVNSNNMECTATDSYRLSKKEIILEEKISEPIDIIVPTRNLNELIKLFINDEGNIELHIFNNKIVFKFGSIIMMSRLINGTFIDTTSLIPNNFLINMKVKLNDLYTAIDRASLLTNENEKNTVKLESFNNHIILSSNIPEIGNVTEKINLIEEIEKNISIAFSSKYMLDALKAFDCENVDLKFNGEIMPIIIKNPESNDLTELVVPIRIS